MDKLTKKQREFFEALAAAEIERWSDRERIRHNRCDVRQDRCLVSSAELATYRKQRLGPTFIDECIR